MTPKISIIVPVYNAEKTLHKCIDSILGQSYKDWELLLIDDGSVDYSATICDEYVQQDKRIKVFHKPNGGVSSARNVGIDNAKGEWVTFVDSDDWLSREALSFYSQEFGVDLVLSAISVHKNNVISKIELPPIKCNDLKQIGQAISSLDRYVGLTVPWAKLLRKSIILENHLSFDERIVSGEDTLFVYKYLYCINSLSCINLVCYHWNNTSFGLSSTKLAIDEIDFVISNIVNALKKIENRYGLNMQIRYYNTILYFITKYDCKGKTLYDLCKVFELLRTRDYFKDLINEEGKFISKGIRRNFADFLLRRGFYKLTAIFYFCTKRFYF